MRVWKLTWSVLNLGPFLIVCELVDTSVYFLSVYAKRPKQVKIGIVTLEAPGSVLSWWRTNVEGHSSVIKHRRRAFGFWRRLEPKVASLDNVGYERTSLYNAKTGPMTTRHWRKLVMYLWINIIKRWRIC